MTPKNLDSSTMKIARSLLGTRIRGARVLLRDLSGLEDTSRRIAVGNKTVKVTSVPARSRLKPIRPGIRRFVFRTCAHLYLLVFLVLSEGAGWESLREDSGVHEAGSAERRPAEAQ